MTSKERATNWLKEKVFVKGLFHSKQNAREFEESKTIYLLRKQGWSVDVAPVETKEQAKSCYDAHKACLRGRGDAFLTEAAQKRLLDYLRPADGGTGKFEKDVLENLAKAPAKPAGQHPPCSWVETCREAAGKMTSEAMLEYQKLPWKRAEAATAFKLETADDINAFPRMMVGLADEILNGRASHLAEQASDFLLSRLARLHPQDRNHLDKNEIREWATGLCHLLRTGSLLALASGEPPRNHPALFEETVRAREELTQWEARFPAESSALRSLQESVWKERAGSKTGPANSIIYPISPGTAYEFEYCVRTADCQKYANLRGGLENKDLLVRPRNAVLGSVQNKLSQPGGCWAEDHLGKFLASEMDTAPSTEWPEPMLSAPMAHDDCPGKELEMLKQDLQKIAQSVVMPPQSRGANDQWKVSEMTFMAHEPGDDGEATPESEATMARADETIRAAIETGNVDKMAGIAAHSAKMFAECVTDQHYRIPAGYEDGARLWWEVAAPAVKKNLWMAVCPKEMRPTLEASAPGAPMDTPNVATAFLLEDNITPTYFLPKKMGQALLATDLPGDLEANDIKFPFDAAIINVETGTFPPIDGFDIRVMSIAVVPQDGAGCSIPYLPHLKITPHDGKPRLVCLALATKGKSIIALGSDNTLAQKVKELGEPTAQELAAEWARTENIPFVDETGKKLVFDPVELQKASQHLPGIAVRLALLMTSRPELVETPPPHTEAKPGTPGQKEPGTGLWGPNFIGRNYNPPTENPANPAESEECAAGGETRTVRPHFRRGHFRKQAFGPGHAQRKIVWIEPVLVGLKQK